MNSSRGLSARVAIAAAVFTGAVIVGPMFFGFFVKDYFVHLLSPNSSPMLVSIFASLGAFACCAALAIFIAIAWYQVASRLLSETELKVLFKDVEKFSNG